ASGRAPAGPGRQGTGRGDASGSGDRTRQRPGSRFAHPAGFPAARLDHPGTGRDHPDRPRGAAPAGAVIGPRQPGGFGTSGGLGNIVTDGAGPYMTHKRATGRTAVARLDAHPVGRRAAKKETNMPYPVDMSVKPDVFAFF